MRGRVAVPCSAGYRCGMKTMIIIRMMGVMLVAAAVSGCSQRADDAGEAPAAVMTTVDRERLAAADAHDGTVDHVVEDCILCNLHMKGTTQYIAQVEGYAVHLCSGYCQKSFEADPAASLAAVADILDDDNNPGQH